MNYDLLLDDNGDLHIGADGDLEITSSLKQAITIRLKWFENEWRYNPSLGLPYYESVFIKAPNLSYIQLRISEAIRDVEGIKEVKNVRLTVEKNTRRMNVSFEATAGDGIVMVENLNIGIGG